MADNDNGKIEALSHQLVFIQAQMDQMVSFMARQTDAMERLARVEEREAGHTETVRRIWVKLEKLERLIEEQDKRLDAMDKELTRHGVFSSGAQAVLAVLLSGGVSLAVGLLVSRIT